MRKHTLNRILDYLLRLVIAKLTKCGLLHGTYILRVCAINLLIQLLAGYSDLVCVYDDYIIAAVKERCVGWLVLSTKNLSNL